MVAKKPKVLIVGAGMAGITAAHTLHTSTPAAALDIQVVEADDRTGGRIYSSEFAGVRVEMGATWIHGIDGSPVYEIARRIGALESPAESLWERMDELPDRPITVAEGGVLVDPSVDGAVEGLYRSLIDITKSPNAKAVAAQEEGGGASVGGFLKRGFERGRASFPSHQVMSNGWSQESLEDALFAMHENMERTYTSADELSTLDLAAECEYLAFPGEEIPIAGGYSRVVDHLASALPPGTIQLGKKVVRIEWRPGPPDQAVDGNGPPELPVRVHFEDGDVALADHVVVTVSLGVLKSVAASAQVGKGHLFSPPLPEFKREAIGRLGFGVVNKLFLEYDGPNPVDSNQPFPFLQLVFDPRKRASATEEAEEKNKIPSWMRRTASIYPVYGGSNLLLAWFAGKEAAELEGLEDEEIVEGVQATLNGFRPAKALPCCSGESHYLGSGACGGGWPWCSRGIVRSIRRSCWLSDPQFRGSYSYVAVGSSGEDFDRMAEPLPHGEPSGTPPLQVLFAGEATHRTHYPTTHGAYFSGMREANRLLRHYKLVSS